MTPEELYLPSLDIEFFSFGEFRSLNEGFKNFLPSDTEEKKKNASEVFSLVHKAYEDQGGIKGNGFGSPQEMVDEIPMWKLYKHSGKLVSVALYKENFGRKRVAMASDGSDIGRKACGSIMMADLKLNRAHMEISGKSLSFVKKQADIKPHLHSYESAEKFHTSRGVKISRPAHDDKEVLRHPELKDHFYVRDIGGNPHTKIMMGTTHNKIEEGTTRTKEEERLNGAMGSLKPGVYDYGNWKMHSQIHGPSQAHERRPEWAESDWHGFLRSSHDALTNPSKHISNPSKLKSDSVLVYSKSKQQGVVLRIVPKDRQNLKSGGETRIETILPKKSSLAKEGTQRIVIEGIEYEIGINLLIID